MNPRDLHPHATWRFDGLWILDGLGGSWSNASLVVEHGKILALGPSSALKHHYAEAQAIDANGYLAIPALINAHTHAALGFFRGLGHGHDQMIERFLFPAEKSLTPELLEPLCYSYLLACLRNGIGTIADHYYFSAGVALAAERLGMRAVIGETVADLGGAFPGVEGWRRARQEIDQWAYSPRITPCIAPHAADTVSRSLLKELADFARARNLPLHLHLSQTTGERQRVLAREQLTPVAYAQACGALGERSLAVHLVAVDDSDIRVLKETGTTVGFCPASQVIYEHLAPIEKFLEADLPVVIATDCAASNDDADLLIEMRIAALFAHDRGQSRFLVDPHSLLQTTTAQPARTLGLDHLTGKLLPGYAADISFLAVELEAEPMAKPEVNLTFSLNGRDVRHVMVDGRFVLIDGLPSLVSKSDLTLAYRAAVQTIHRRLVPSV